MGLFENIFGNKKRNDKIAKIASAIVMSVYMQFRLAGHWRDTNNDSELVFENPDLPSNDFVIGYISGYCIEFMENTQLDYTDEESFIVSRATFVNLYGEDKGMTLLTKVVASVDNQSKEMTNGAVDGRNDAIDQINLMTKRGGQIPNRLVRYLQSNRFKPVSKSAKQKKTQRTKKAPKKSAAIVVKRKKRSV